jgi:hypothetical protein
MNEAVKSHDRVQTNYAFLTRQYVEVSAELDATAAIAGRK